MNIFNYIKNILGSRVNPATEDTLAGIRGKTDLVTFDNGSVQGNLNVDIKSSIIIPVLNSTHNLATKATLDNVQVQTDKLNFDENLNLVTSGLAPTLDVTGVNVKDSTTTTVNPATMESAQMWRRIFQLLQAKSTVSGYILYADLVNFMAPNVQKVLVDGFGNSTYGVGPTDATVPVFTVANDLITYPIVPPTYNGWSDLKYADAARVAYTKNIRQNLIFS